MKCPRCKHKSEVLETIDAGARKKRRRRCLAPSCQYRFHSYEIAEGDVAPASSDPAALPEWIENIRPGGRVDKEAITAAYRVDQRRKEIDREQRRKARLEREFGYDDDPPLSKEDLMLELRGYR